MMFPEHEIQPRRISQDVRWREQLGILLRCFSVDSVKIDHVDRRMLYSLGGSDDFACGQANCGVGISDV
jgi:hypothetical protein